MKCRFNLTKLTSTLSLGLILLSFLGIFSKSNPNTENKKQNTEIIEKDK